MKLKSIIASLFIFAFLLEATNLSIAAQEEIELEPIHVALSDTLADEISSKNVTIVYNADGIEESLEERLDFQNSVDVQRRGILGIQSDLSIRGSTSEEVMVSANGILLNNPQTSHHNLDIPIPSSAIERLEVARGSSPYIWSQGAMGGAINIRTKRPIVNEGEASFFYGSDETQKGSLYISGNKDAFGLNFSCQEATSNGWRENTDFKEFTLGSSALLKLDKISSYFYGGYGEKEFGANDFYGDYNSKEWTNTLFLNWDNTIEIEQIKISPKFYYRVHHDKYMLDIDNPDRYINHHRTNTEGMQIEAEGDLKEYGFISLSADLRIDRINSVRLGKDGRSKNSYLASHRNHRNRLFGYDLSLRVDDYSDYDTEILPQAGIFFNLMPNLRLRSNIAKAARPPSYTELFYLSPANRGNKDLSSEESMNYEAGVDFSMDEGEKIKARCTFFRRDSKDLIDWIKASSSQSFYQANNRTEVKTEGIEAEIDAKLTKWLRIEANYTYIDSDIKESDDYISKYALNHPDHKVFAKIEVPLGSLTQSVNLLYKNRKGYSSYILFGCDIDYKLNKYSSLFASADNIFDIEYEDIRDIPLPGRQLRAGAKIRF